jgi:hypothetical protein
MTGIEFIGIQILGIAFGLFMAYLTYLYYRRRNFSGNDFAVWMSIWIGFLVVTIFPQPLEFLVKPLMVNRLLDLLMVVSFMVLFVLMFMTYRTNKMNEKKINRIVREVALMEKKDKGKK